MLSSTVRCGKRLNCWNTMPVSRRISWMLRRSRVSSMPSTTMRPASCSSSRLMQRIIVDLPEPDGPMTTTTSLRAIFKSMRRERGEVAESLGDALELDHRVALDLGGVGEHVAMRSSRRSSRPDSQSSFEPLALAAHRDASDPEQQHEERERLGEQLLALELGPAPSRLWTRCTPRGTRRLRPPASCP